MYQRLLVPLDGSETSRQGLREALALAREQKSSLVLLHVIGEYPLVMEMSTAKGAEAARDSLFEHADAMLREAKTVAAAQGVESVARLRDRHGGSIADAILAEARESDCDLIVLGTHGRRGLSRALLGSDAEQVLRHSTLPVLVVREARPKAA